MIAHATPMQAVEASEQRLELPGMDWDRYVAISNLLPDATGLRLVFLDGGLTLLTTSRHHDRVAEVAGRATFRVKDLNVGVEGDATFYFDSNAIAMTGSANIDLSQQPAPDLVVEVEVANPAEKAIQAWDRLKVPEVWQFNVPQQLLRFWHHRSGGGYELALESLNLPGVTPTEIVEQIRLAEALPYTTWIKSVRRWASDRRPPRAD
jgi:Uma2 family endonuclease